MAGNEADWAHDLEVRQRLQLGMAVSYIADNPLGPPSQGTLTEFRRTQAVVQDSLSRRHRAIPYAAIVPKAPPRSILKRHPRRARNAKSSSSATRSGSPTNT
jgi:hypothetical protein